MQNFSNISNILKNGYSLPSFWAKLGYSQIKIDRKLIALYSLQSKIGVHLLNDELTQLPTLKKGIVQLKLPKWDKNVIFFIIVKKTYPNFYCFDVTLHQTNLEQGMTTKYLDVHPGKISTKNAAPASACYLLNSNCNSCHYMAMVHHWYLIGQDTKVLFSKDNNLPHPCWDFEKKDSLTHSDFLLQEKIVFKCNELASRTSKDLNFVLLPSFLVHWDKILTNKSIPSTFK